MDYRTIKCEIHAEEWFPVYGIRTEIDPDYLRLDLDGYVRAGDPNPFSYEIPIELVRAHAAVKMLFEQVQDRIKAFIEDENSKEKSAKIEFGSRIAERTEE